MDALGSLPWFVAQLDTTPSWSQLAQLGVIALAMAVGAGAVFRWGVVRLEKRMDAQAEELRVHYGTLLAEVRSDRDRERDDRVKSEERERAVREATMKEVLPPVLEANRLLGELTLAMRSRRDG